MRWSELLCSKPTCDLRIWPTMEDSPTSEWARLSCSCVLACWEGNSFFPIGIITNTFQPMIWNSLPTRVVGVWLPVGLSGDHWVGLAPEPKLHCAPRKERLLGFVNTQISHATLGSGASWSYSTIIGLHKICPQQVYFSLNATFCCRATKWFSVRIRLPQHELSIFD